MKSLVSREVSAHSIELMGRGQDQRARASESSRCSACCRIGRRSNDCRERKRITKGDVVVILNGRRAVLECMKC
jgi:hypothetical protein